MKQNRKTEIIHTAARLFKEKGYNAVSMRDLAEALGIKAASLYNHISSKQEILSAIIIHVAEAFTAHIAEVFPKSSSSIEKLEEIIAMHVQITIQKTNFLACLNNDWMHLNPNDLENYLQMRNAYEANFRAIILHGIETNELKNSNPEIILFSILSTLRTLYLWYSKNTSFSTETLQKDLTENLLLGVVK